MNSLAMLASFLACIWLSWYITRRFVLFALERRLVDVPNERSSHSRVTPRGGGISFVILFLIVTAVLGLFCDLPIRFMTAILAGAGVAWVGYLDDCHGLSIKVRLLVQLAVTSTAFLLICGTPLTNDHYPTLLNVAGAVFAVILYTWVINIVNFMDGIDGLAASEAVCLSATCCLLTLMRHGPTETGFLFGVLACASFGFLYWNWPSAHIFMGDAGSYFLGFSIGALMLLSVVRRELELWVVPILLGVFAVDATLTVLKRMLRGELWYKAHRLHGFQHAALVFGHRTVTLTVVAINLLWLAPLALLADILPRRGPALLVLAWLPLVVLSYLFHSGEVLIEHAIPRWRTFALIAGCMPKNSWIGLLNLVRRLKRSMPWLRACWIAGLCVVSMLLAALSLITPRNGAVPREFAVPLLMFGAAQATTLLAFGMHRCHWHLIALEDLPDIMGVGLVSTLAGVVLEVAVIPGEVRTIPASFFVIQTLLLVAFIIFIRMAAASYSRGRQLTFKPTAAKRVIIYGANSAGLEICSSLRQLGAKYRVVGFVDPRISMKGVPIAGGSVLGLDSDIKRLVTVYNVDGVLLSSSAAGSAAGRRFLQHCRDAAVDVHVLPSIEHGLETRVETKAVQASA